MRALCGAIITAGALIGLGLLSIGMGTRYQTVGQRFNDAGRPEWVKFSQMDTPLMVTMIALIAALVIGLGLSFIGLALHHERRKRELEELHARLHSHARTSTDIQAPA